MIGNGEMIIRLLLAGLFGALIGIEREYRSKAAGLRTHLLVSIGSALLMLLSQYGFGGQGDPARVAAQIVSGIGFIGAGAIIMDRRQAVHGLTTAAGIWVASAIGMTTAAGMYVLSATATGLLLFGLEIAVFAFHRRSEDKSDHRDASGDAVDGENR
jgi:putative Mg2+ transporter-C (MgtC) family protein